MHNLVNSRKSCSLKKFGSFANGAVLTCNVAAIFDNVIWRHVRSDDLYVKTKTNNEWQMGIYSRKEK